MYRIGSVSAFGLLALVACAATPVDSRPFEERYAADELEAMYFGKAPFCEVYKIGRLQTNQKCRPVDPELREKIKVAWEKQYRAELAEAPACIREETRMLPRGWLEEHGFDPDSETLGAELVVRGMAIGKLINSECAPAVCDWQRRHHPRKPSVYCKDPAETAT